MACARWAALGKDARAHKRSAQEELAQLVRSTPGMQMPELANQDPTTDSPDDQDQDQTPWDATHFADKPGQPPLLWPCWQWAYVVWQHMADQWRVAPMGGLIGLDLSALPVVERSLGVPRKERQMAYTGLRTFAREQQKHWASKAPKPKGPGHD